MEIKTIENRILIGENAHLILPTHRLLDKAKEAHKGEAKIGTTGKGIGPCWQPQQNCVKLLKEIATSKTTTFHSMGKTFVEKYIKNPGNITLSDAFNNI